MAVIRVKGQVENQLELTFEDLGKMPGQIEDVSQLIAKRQGAAVAFKSIVDAAKSHGTAEFVTILAENNRFSASVKLHLLRDALLLYKYNGGPLPAKMGGPYRFLIPDTDACQTGDVDKCANVKFVETFEFSVAPGHDTRPTSEEEHAHLHRH